METNKARKVREALGLTPTEAGQLLLGYSKRHAHDQWSQWERAEKLSRPTEAMLDIILILIMARDFKTRGASSALDFVLKTMSEREQEMRHEKQNKSCG